MMKRRTIGGIARSESITRAAMVLSAAYLETRAATSGRARTEPMMNELTVISTVLRMPLATELSIGRHPHRSRTALRNFAVRGWLGLANTASGAPSSMTEPSAMTTTLSDTFIAKAISWVTMIIVM